MEFVKKSAEELAKMNADDLQAYYVGKLNHEKKEMTARIEALEAEKELLLSVKGIGERS